MPQASAPPLGDILQVLHSFQTKDCSIRRSRSLNDLKGATAKAINFLSQKRIMVTSGCKMILLINHENKNESSFPNDFNENEDGEQASDSPRYVTMTINKKPFSVALIQF